MLEDTYLKTVQEKIIKTSEVIQVVVRLREKIKKRDSGIKLLYDKYKSTERELNILKVQAEICELDHKPMENKYKKLTEKYNALVQEHNEYVNKTELRHQQVFLDLENQAEKCKTCEDYLKKNRFLKNSNQTLRIQVAKLTKDLKSKIAETSENVNSEDIEISKSKLAKLERTTERLSNEISEYQEQIITLELNNASLNENIKRLQTQLDEANKKCIELEREKAAANKICKDKQTLDSLPLVFTEEEPSKHLSEIIIDDSELSTIDYQHKDVNELNDDVLFDYINELKDVPQLLSPLNQSEESVEDISTETTKLSVPTQLSFNRKIQNKRRLQVRNRKRLKQLKMDIVRDVTSYINKKIKPSLQIKNDKPKRLNSKKLKMARWQRIRQICMSTTDSEEDAVRDRKRRRRRTLSSEQITVEEIMRRNDVISRSRSEKFDEITRFYNTLSVTDDEECDKIMNSPDSGYDCTIEEFSCITSIGKTQESDIEKLTDSGPDILDNSDESKGVESKSDEADQLGCASRDFSCVSSLCKTLENAADGEDFSEGSENDDFVHANESKRNELKSNEAEKRVCANEDFSRVPSTSKTKETVTNDDVFSNGSENDDFGHPNESKRNELKSNEAEKRVCANEDFSRVPSTSKTQENVTNDVVFSNGSESDDLVHANESKWNELKSNEAEKRVCTNEDFSRVPPVGKTQKNDTNDVVFRKQSENNSLVDAKKLNQNEFKLKEGEKLEKAERCFATAGPDEEFLGFAPNEDGGRGILIENIFNAIMERIHGIQLLRRRDDATNERSVEKNNSDNSGDFNFQRANSAAALGGSEENLSPPEEERKSPRAKKRCSIATGRRKRSIGERSKRVKLKRGAEETNEAILDDGEGVAGSEELRNSGMKEKNAINETGAQVITSFNLFGCDLSDESSSNSHDNLSTDVSTLNNDCNIEGGSSDLSERLFGFDWDDAKSPMEQKALQRNEGSMKRSRGGGENPTAAENAIAKRTKLQRACKRATIARRTKPVEDGDGGKSDKVERRVVETEQRVDATRTLSNPSKSRRNDGSQSRPFKRPNRTVNFAQRDSPASPPPVLSDELETETRIIPLERVDAFSEVHTNKLLQKLVTFSDDSKVLNEVVAAFRTQDEDFIITTSLRFAEQNVVHKTDMRFTPPAPMLTVIERSLVVLLSELNCRMPTLFDKFLDAAEKRILTGCRLETVRSLTVLYLAVCKLERRIHRIRRTVCDAFYYMGDLCVPFLFAVLTNWIEVLPKRSQVPDEPLVKVIFQVVHMSNCSKPGYNLSPLKKLLEEYYGYPKERYNSDELFYELFQKFNDNPSKRLECCLLILCKNHPKSWIEKQISEHIKPLLTSGENNRIKLLEKKLLKIN